MSKSKWELYKEKNGSTPADIFDTNTEWVDSELSQKRLDICKQCPELINITKQCKKCGCFMVLKTKIEHSRCPIDKW